MSEVGHKTFFLMLNLLNLSVRLSSNTKLAIMKVPISISLLNVLHYNFAHKCIAKEHDPPLTYPVINSGRRPDVIVIGKGRWWST